MTDDKDGGPAFPQSEAERASQMKLALLRVTARHAVEKCTSDQQLRAAIDALLSARKEQSND